VLDEREALARLIGEAAGLGRIPAEAARKAGDKAGKLVWVKKGTPPIKADLADARRAVQRRASKLPEGASLEEALEDARIAVLRTTVTLQALPSREECEAAPRAARPLPEHDARLVKWCAGHGLQAEYVVARMSKAVHERQKRERAWQPRGSKQALAKARRLQAVAEEDDLCTCSEGVPSFLCRVNRCFTSAAFGHCEERRLPGQACDCMGWEAEDERDEDSLAITKKDRRISLYEESRCLPWWIAPNPPTPAGGWPVYDPAAVKRASDADYDAMMREYPNGFTLPGGQHYPLGGHASSCKPQPARAPAPAAGVTARELFNLTADGKAKIQATCARQDLTDEQKMTKIQRIASESQS
jgi:hypothetical protein